MTSRLGSLLDPLSDKILAGTLTLSLFWNGSLGWPLAVIIVGRDVLLLLGAMYYRYKSLRPNERGLLAFFDPSMPRAEVRPSLLSKINTFLQFSLFLALIASPSMINFHGMMLSSSYSLLDVAKIIVGTSTIASGIDYALTSRTVFRSLRR